MEFQAVGLVGILVIGAIGWILTLYWTLRLMRYADARWPARTNRVIFVMALGFIPLMMGGWLIATLLWSLFWIGNRRSRTRLDPN